MEKEKEKGNALQFACFEYFREWGSFCNFTF